MRVTVEDGRVVRIQGDPDHPPTHGALCTKVSRYAERSYHPERVLQPLRRVGPKGSGRFEPIGWDAALDLIAERLKAIAARDPQAILPYSYAGTMGLVQGESMAARFFHRLGASLLDRTICSAAGGEALTATYGGKLGMHVEHFADSRLIVIWGSNSITANLHFWTFAQAAKRAGARLICIDPRRTETAQKCHQHIALRPGTDGALALGVMHELITHGWLDADYIERHVQQGETGWPALRERALQWPPERVAEVCGIDAEAVRELAQAWGTTSPAAIRLNYGMQRVHGGGSAARLIALLPCLTGAWRHRAGGLLLSSSGWFRGARNDAALQRPDLLASHHAGRTPRTINMSTIGDDLLRPSSPAFGPKIEAVVVYNSNPVAVAPDSAKVVQGFAREDLFTVVLEHFMTDTADHADIVLPATTQLEHWDTHAAYGHTYALLNQPAIAPLGQARSNAQIFRDLAARMGFDEPCFADSDEDLVRQAWQADRVDPARLREVGWVKLDLPEAPFADGGFATRDGRASVDGGGLGVPDHVPNLECAESTPALAARYPLAMISPPARHFLNSTFVNVKSLRAIEGRPLVEIHPQDAADAWHRRRRAGARLQRPRQPPVPCRGQRARAARRGQRAGHLVAQVRRRRHQCQPADAPGPDRHRPRPVVLRLPGRRRAGVRRGWGMAAMAATSALTVAAAVGVMCAITGCSTAGYYGQSIGGHVALMQQARPVADWLAEPQTDPVLRERLALSQRLRDWAVTELKLPDNRSYRSYAELGRAAAVWNVVAAPELSLTLKTWCFPVMGCVGYRGYFDRAEADALAATLRAEGLEVAVYPVPAYSTLGWTDWLGGDPLLSTFIRWPEGELARLIFHELAHQVVYVGDDTSFNESFATAVERLGGQRWLAERASAPARAEYEVFDRRRRDFRALTLRARGGPAPAVRRRGAGRRRQAPGQGGAHGRAARRLRAPQEPTTGAALPATTAGSIAPTTPSSACRPPTTNWVPAFERLFEREGRDFDRFYAEVARLAALPKAERLDTLRNATSP